MPVTIKSSMFQYKDTNGEYVGVDAIADKTTAEQVAQVNSAISAKITEMASATATNISAIETKGQQTLNSIPGDYTELSEDVENLKSAMQSDEILALDDISFTFVQGSINGIYGTYDPSYTQRITSTYDEYSKKVFFNIPETFDYNVFFYSQKVEINIQGYLSNTGWLNGNHMLGNDISVPSDAVFYRFIVRYKAGGVILPSDFAGYKILTEKAQPELIENYKPPITFLCRDGRVSNNVPPNSKWAIKATANNQYDKIRFSVTKTTDGYYVAVHDTTINDLAVNADGSAISTTIRTADCTLAQLNQYDWGHKFGALYTGMGVPMLDVCLKYASMYNLSVALDFKWAVTDEDITNVTNMLAKYGQLDAILFAVSITAMQKFQAKSKKLSYLFAGTYEQMESQAGSLRLLLNGYNHIYLAFRPMGEVPTTETMTLAAVNGFDIMYSPIEGMEELEALGFDKGVTLMECHYISNIKSAIREYADSLM